MTQYPTTHRFKLAALYLLFAAGIPACTPVQPSTVINAPASPPSRSDQPFYPGILPRSAWAKGSPDSAHLKPMLAVKRIVVCHSGDMVPFVSDDLQATAQHLEYTRQYHRNRMFADIGWHYAIDRAGRVWQLRSPTSEPQAVRNYNENTIAVVILGNYSKQELTVAQKVTLITFLHALRLHHQLPIGDVFTKRELVPVIENPGENVQVFLDQIRREHRLL
jgi:hypothetical protein